MTPPQLSRKHMDEIRHLFAGPLSTRLGRPPETIRDEGLLLYDFPQGQVVEITLEDRSTMTLRHAFVVTDIEQRLLGVFTEHCGYHFFPLADTVCRVVRDGVTIATYGGDDELPYRVIVTRSESDQRFLASIPALPGCSVDGITASAAESEARAVGRAMLQTMTEQGHPLPASDLDSP